MRRLTVVVALAAGACGGEATSAGTATVRDSAGVRIVENSGPAWTSGQGWTVGDTPMVDIGTRGGDPAYELDQVRGVLQESDGRLVLANASTNDVRIYDAGGTHVLTSGREGSGPGEFQQMAGIWIGPGDSLLIAEPVQRRLSVLDRDAKFARVFSLGGAGGQLMPVNGRVELAIPVGWSADGSVVGISQSFAINEARAGMYRDTLVMIRFGPDGAARDTLGRFPGIEMEQMTLTIQGQSISTPSEVPLGKQTVTAVGKDRVYVAQNKAWEIEVRGLDGKLLTLVRAPITPAKITPAEADANRADRIEAMEAFPQVRNLPEEIKKQVTARVREAHYPETYAFFANLMVDPQGNLWAQLVTPPSQKSQRYAVIDTTGRWLGVVDMPAEFRPTFVGSDALYGIWTDESDVEHVRGYSIRRPVGAEG